ncbi:hydroxyethylthiazole kinase [uncultured Methanoregula sp.]|uniref:hydroxyethylthiazole kinase n=1 Tax=uncultured Methanoregula sp. TaxID=1005933 RepID=UPI002AAB16A7|nr:hydroxyethylthiazole kinase [uncultured Methanoregula sp.]
MKAKQLSDLFGIVREKHPLVHHITNYVTVNDCANITMCAGGAPVMADAPEEVAEMAGVAGSLVLNIGTLNKAQVKSMILAGGMANDRKIPVILDPVGVGATRFRTETARHIMSELKISILKGNAGEIGVLAGAGGKVRGVDSHGLTGDPVAVVRDFARAEKLTVVASGPTDIVTDGKRVFLVNNGHPMMGSISGTGCMAASVTGVFAAESSDMVLASAAALAAFGIAGERAAAGTRGPFSFKTALFDELARLTPADLGAHARVISQE